MISARGIPVSGASIRAVPVPLQRLPRADRAEALGATAQAFAAVKHQVAKARSKAVAMTDSNTTALGLSPSVRGNLLLEAMPQYAGLLPLERTKLEVGEVLYAPGKPIRHAYFVETGVIFILGSAGAGWRLKVGMVGFEGMAGLELLLGGEVAAHEAVVQSEGSALRLTAAALREATARSKSLNDFLLRFAQTFMVQTTHAAIAAGRGSLEERLARTLLMWQDRAREESWRVTHGFLAMLMGVYRPSATLAIQLLEGKRLIRASRNRIRILDRAGLERMAKGFYGVPEEAYRRLFPSDNASAKI